MELPPMPDIDMYSQKNVEMGQNARNTLCKTQSAKILALHKKIDVLSHATRKSKYSVFAPFDVNIPSRLLASHCLRGLQP